MLLDKKYSLRRTRNLVCFNILLLVLFSTTIYSQTLRAQIGAGFAIHNKNISPDDPPADPIVPSIGSMYDDNAFVQGEAMFLLNTKPQVPLISLTYDYQSLAFSLPAGATVLGSTLNIHSLGASIGVGFNNKISPEIKICNYITAGYVFKFYSGQTEPDPNTRTTSNYENARAIRLGTGMNFSGMFGPNASIALSVTYDFGTLRRGNIDVYKNDEYVSSLIPTGDLVLPDNDLHIQIGVCYDINF